MGAEHWIIGGLVAVVGAVVLCGFLLVVRARILVNRAGSILCQFAIGEHARWRSGVCCYEAESVAWYALRSLSPAAVLRLAREDLVILERSGSREPSSTVIVKFKIARSGEPLKLGLSYSAYEGFASWLEAAPPSREGVL